MALKEDEHNRDGITLPSQYIASLKNCLMNEEIKHSRTQEKLEDTEEKLRLALHEIDLLHDQISNEKKYFQQKLVGIQKICDEKDREYAFLQLKYEELERKLEDQKNIASEKNVLIDKLENTVKDNKRQFRKDLMEKEVHCQQERYIKQHYFCSPKPK